MYFDLRLKTKWYRLWVKLPVSVKLRGSYSPRRKTEDYCQMPAIVFCLKCPVWITDMSWAIVTEEDLSAF